MNYYSVFDSVLGEWSPLFPAKNLGVVLRMCKNEPKFKTVDIKDFSVKCFCEFDSNTGNVTLVDDLPISLVDLFSNHEEDE